MSIVAALRRNPGRVLVGVASAVYVLLSLWLTRKAGAPLSPDALEYAAVARSLVAGAGYTINLVEIHPGFLDRVRHLHELHGLLHPFILAPLFWLWGPHAALVRIPGVYFVAGLALVTFELSRFHFGSLAGCIAAALLLVRQDIALYGIVGGDDGGWAFFSSVSLLCFVRGVESGNRRWQVLAGAAAAFAALEKVSGLALPLVFGAVVLAVPKARSAVGLRDWARLAVPVALAGALYAVRNYLLHGGIGFRFSALDWLAKVNPAFYFAYYQTPPSLRDVWTHLGFSRVLELTAHQCRLLGSVAIADAGLMIGGPLALVWLVRKSPVLAWFGIVYSALNALIVCFVYHVEIRYLLALYPVYFVALSAVAVTVVHRTIAALSPVVARRIALAAAVTAGVTFAVAFSRVMLMQRAIGHGAQAAGTCDDAVAFLRATVRPEEPILTSSPWFVAWAAERPAVNAPTNGETAIVSVANHYKTDWALDGLPSFGTADVGAALRRLARQGTPIRPELAYDGANCNVYRLHRAE